MSVLVKIKKHGISGILKVILKKLFGTELMKFNYLKINLDYNSIQEKLKIFDLNVNELTYEDFLLGDKNEFFGEKLTVIKNRFNDPTYKCYGVVENGVLVYSAWISFQKLGLPVPSNIKLLPNEGYFEDDYCHPSYRGQGIHGKMNSYRLSKLYEFGKTECIIVIISTNKPAIKTQINSGARNLGSFTAGKIFGMPFVLLNKKKYDSQ